MLDTAINVQSKDFTKTPTMPHVLLRLEGLAVLLGAVAIYSRVSGDWGAFLLLLLAPDLGTLGYLVSNAVGSAVYNTAHFYALPVTLAAIALLAGAPIGVQIALIWVSHIGMDRALGYGLKYPTEFKDTHLSRV